MGAGLSPGASSLAGAPSPSKRWGGREGGELPGERPGKAKGTDGGGRPCPLHRSAVSHWGLRSLSRGATSALVGPGTRAPAVLKRPLRPGPLRLLTAPHGRSPFTSGPGRGPRCFHDDAACVFPLERSLTWPQVLRCAARPPPSLSGDGAGARAPPLASLGFGSRGAAPALPDEDTACVPMSGGVACPSRGDRFSMAGASPRPGSSPRLAAAWKVRGEPWRARPLGCWV